MNNSDYEDHGNLVVCGRMPFDAEEELASLRTVLHEIEE